MTTRGLIWMGLLLCFLSGTLAALSAMQGLWYLTAFDCIMFLGAAGTTWVNIRRIKHAE